MKFRTVVLMAVVGIMACNKGKQASPKKAAGDPEFASRVKAEFLHAWRGYWQYARGHDELRPLSKKPRDWYAAPLLFTPIDAFSTMKLMGLEEEAAAAKQLIFQRLSFDHDMEVQLFEVNIRILGGLLSAYQLDGDPQFLALAQELADRLAPAFDSPTGMPYRFVNLKTGKPRDPHNNPAEIGTLILEWGTLSRHTGDERYSRMAKRALRELYRRRSAIDLVASRINVETGEWEDATAHIGGMIDSYYEYLMKGWLLFGDEELAQMWSVHYSAIERYLADSTGSGLWYGQADFRSGRRTGTRFGALEAFFPGVLALAGEMERARALQESCFAMWRLTGIEPEQIDYRTMKVVVDGYPLRPENAESAFYLYRFTEDPVYLQRGREYFESLVRYCRTDAGYAALKSVITFEKADEMPSFFLAETLKYLYLLFAGEQAFDFHKMLFNTEAHPLRVWERPGRR